MFFTQTISTSKKSLVIIFFLHIIFPELFSSLSGRIIILKNLQQVTHVHQTTAWLVFQPSEEEVIPK